METNEAVVKERLEALNAKLDVYEVILGKQKYLAGNVSNNFWIIWLSILTNYCASTERHPC